MAESKVQSSDGKIMGFEGSTVALAAIGIGLVTVGGIEYCNYRNSQEEIKKLNDRINTLETRLKALEGCQVTSANVDAAIKTATRTIRRQGLSIAALEVSIDDLRGTKVEEDEVFHPPMPKKPQQKPKKPQLPEESDDDMFATI